MHYTVIIKVNPNKQKEITNWLVKGLDFSITTFSSKTDSVIVFSFEGKLEDFHLIKYCLNSEHFIHYFSVIDIGRADNLALTAVPYKGIKLNVFSEEFAKIFSNSCLEYIQEDWLFFLPQDLQNKPIDLIQARIFQPRYYPVILSWLKTSKVGFQQKVDFIKAMLTLTSNYRLPTISYNIITLYFIAQSWKDLNKYNPQNNWLAKINFFLIKEIKNNSEPFFWRVRLYRTFVNKTLKLYDCLRYC